MIQNFRDPIGYILNLGYGRGTSNKTQTRDKIKVEHSCISFAFQSLKHINKENEFQCVVLGRTVHVKVWIHYFIGDTEGNSKWLGQYPGNREGVRPPYCDCKCQFHDLSNPNPTCIYITMDDINLAKKRKWDDEDARCWYRFSWKPISIYMSLTLARLCGEWRLVSKNYEARSRKANYSRLK